MTAETREVLTMFLNESGAHVVAADSAAKAVELLEQQAPDVIIADIGMPGEDGYAFINKLPEFKREQGSAAGDRADRVRAQGGSRARAQGRISAAYLKTGGPVRRPARRRRITAAPRPDYLDRSARPGWQTTRARLDLRGSA